MLVIKTWPITTVLAGPVFPNRGGRVISILRKLAFVCAPLFALFRWRCGRPAGTPGRSLFRLQIGFLYRSASLIHFPTGSDRYSLTRLKVRETDKTLLPMGRLTAPPHKGQYRGGLSPPQPLWGVSSSPKLSPSCLLGSHEARGQGALTEQQG